ncbi:MAG: hypothetical protein EZS28_030304, partial [Streblomastix strix]
KQQQENKQQKDNNNDKEKSDRFEALFQQGEEQRRKLEFELRKEQEERMKAVNIRKEIEEKFVQNEEERRKVKQQLRFEEAEKISALNQVEELQKNEQEEHKRRIDTESENRSLKWEIDKMKKEIDKLKYENEEEKNQKREFQIKYDIEVDDKLKEIDEKLREVEARKQIEIQLKKEQYNKQDTIKRIEEQERKIAELDQRLLKTVNELQIKNEENERLNLKAEKESTKAKEEEIKRKQFEIENERLEMENWNVKRDNEKVKIVSERLNSELGEEKMNEQIDLSENLLKEQDDQIKRLRDDLEREILEKRRHEEEIARLRQDLINMREQIGQQPVAIEPILSVPDTQYCYISGDTFFRTSRPLEWKYLIAVDPIITKGIVYFEGIFYNHDRELFYIGVQNTQRGANDQDAIIYNFSGDICHIGNKFISGNNKFICDQKVGIEVNLISIPRKLTFFVDGIEQPNQFVDIPKSIRFFAFTKQRYSQFRVTRFERRATSQAKGVANSLNWIWGIDYIDTTALSLPLIGDEIQKKKIQQQQKAICQYIDNKFNGNEDEQGRLQLIEAGVTVNLLTIFETRELNEITEPYIDAFFIFTSKSSDEIVQQLIKKKDPFPGLIRLLDHSNDQIVSYSITSIDNIFIDMGKGSDQNQPHPCFQTVEQCGGVEKIFTLFKMNLNKQFKDRSAICVGRLFRAREIKNPEMNQVIVYLKQLINDPVAQTKNAAKNVLKGLAKNEVNRVFIESDGFKIPE